MDDRDNYILKYLDDVITSGIIQKNKPTQSASASRQLFLLGTFLLALEKKSAARVLNWKRIAHSLTLHYFRPVIIPSIIHENNSHSPLQIKAINRTINMQAIAANCTIDLPTKALNE